MKRTDALRTLVAIGFAFAVTALPVHTAVPEPSPECCIGMTVARALAFLPIPVSKPGIIEEPPGTLRGVEVVDIRGRSVAICVQRREDLPDDRHFWELRDFEGDRVVGIARQRGKSWTFERWGDVVWFYWWT